MATNVSNATSAKISANTSSSNYIPSPSSAAPSSFASDGHSQRRAGGSGSFGAGAATRVAQAAPRSSSRQVNARGTPGKSRRYKVTDEDAFAESVIMNSTSSRKGQTSITHLMNFSLPPRPPRPQHNQHLRYARKYATAGQGSGYHAIDKARYVHANYRFIVDPRQDYRAQSVDADIYLDWTHVLQILASPQSQDAACPICLGEPNAPRMARCGHIFCMHCLIRYMHSTDDSEQYPEKRARWKKCPICYDSIYQSETKPVRWFVGQEGPSPHEGADIVLRLVMRPAGSTLALPKEAEAMARVDEIPWHFAADVMDYARVMRGTKDYMLSQFDAEITQLESVEKHDELLYGDSSEWTQRAIRAIREAKKRLVESVFAPESATKEAHISDNSHPSLHNFHISSQSDSKSTSIPKPHPHLTGSSALSANIANFRQSQQQQQQQQGQGTTTTSDYYFYQALLHYYLAPLDIRILKAAFGDFSAFPSTVLPRVDHISHGHVVDEDLRRRAKYLAHLPFGCEVSFLECDWTDIVPANILEQFKSDIERRRKRNTDKEMREEKERLRAEKEEDDKRWAAVRQRRSTTPPNHPFRPDDFQPLGASEMVSTTTGSVESTSPGWYLQRPNGAGFASLASPSTSPNNHRTVWGTMAVQGSSPELAPSHRHDVNLDDGWLQGWEKDLLQHDDELVAQVEAASLGGESSKGATAAASVVAAATAGVPAGRKKKGKKITLMSTNVRRGA